MKIFLAFTFIINIVFSQSEKSFTYRLGINKLDFHTGLQYTYHINRFEPFVALETGIIRTFFQRRFFPRFSFGLAYDLKYAERWHFNPLVNVSISALQINKETGSKHYWTESYLGYQFKFGEKIRFCQSTQIGWMWENYPNVVTRKRSWVSTLGYYGSIGIEYAL